MIDQCSSISVIHRHSNINVIHQHSSISVINTLNSNVNKNKQKKNHCELNSLTLAWYINTLT